MREKSCYNTDSSTTEASTNILLPSTSCTLADRACLQPAHVLSSMLIRYQHLQHSQADSSCYSNNPAFANSSLVNNESTNPQPLRLVKPQAKCTPPKLHQKKTDPHPSSSSMSPHQLAIPNGAIVPFGFNHFF